MPEPVDERQAGQPLRLALVARQDIVLVVRPAPRRPAGGGRLALRPALARRIRDRLRLRGLPLGPGLWLALGAMADCVSR